MRSGFRGFDDVVAVFGGAFDPPHLGHQEAISGLFRSPGVKRVLVIPAGGTPQKAGTTSAAHRLKMAQIAFGSMKEVEVDDREIRRFAMNQRPSYTFDTLQELRREIPQLAFVIGTDQLEKLPTWHRFPEVLGLSHWIVLERKPLGADRGRKTLAEWSASGLAAPAGSLPQGGDQWRLSQGTSLTVVPTEALALSSTGIREAISRDGQPPENTVSPEILSYLMQSRLYGMQEEERPKS